MAVRGQSRHSRWLLSSSSRMQSVGVGERESKAQKGPGVGGGERLKSCFSLKNSALYYKLLKCFFFEYKYKYVQSLSWTGILLSSSSIS